MNELSPYAAKEVTVLGEKQQTNIPTSGKIRAGIMVLTATAKKNKQATDLYADGVKRGISYGAIQTEIFKKTQLKNSMYPLNVPYFTVRGSDFANPDTAGQIFKKYATEGDEGLQLYRFPLIFPVDQWQLVLPHGLKTFTASELMYWSEYDADGTRYCKMHGEIKIDEKAKRATRTYGGRPVVNRPDNNGICDPDNCPQYQDRQCNLTGSLVFYIPEISGASAIQLPMTSFYAMQGIRSQLELMAFNRGRISGMLGDEPLFYLTKKQNEVSMIDPKTGKAKRVKQWIITLEGNVEMSKLFAANELQKAKDAVNILENNSQATIEDESVIDEDGDGSDIISDEEDIYCEACTVAGGAERPVYHTAPVCDLPDDVKEEDTLKFKIQVARGYVKEALELLHVTVGEYTAYAIQEYGESWTTDLNLLNRIVSDLEKEHDEELFQAKIKVE